MNAQFTKVINLLERLGTNGGLRIARLELLERRSYTTHITLKEITLPHLRELQVRFGGTASLRHIASSATQLETLDISFMDLKSMDPSYAWWPTIRSLKFTGTYGGAGQGYPEALSNMLSKTRSLKHLELLRFYNSDDPPDLQLPRLLTLTTDAHIGVVQINAPLLTHLTLVRDNSYWRRTPDTFTEQIFPSLTHLDVEYISQRLRYFQAPALHTFVIRAPFNSFFNKSAARELWFDKNEKPNTLNPIVLHIIKTFIHQQALIEILSSMDAIEELHIQGITAKKWLFSYLGQPIKLPRSSSVTVDPNPSLDPNTDPLATNLSDSSELLEESDNLGFEQGQVQDDDNLDSESNPRWPLPHLKEVSFDISGHKQATEVKNVKNLRLAVKKCLKARKLAGLEIECVRLRVEENSGWVYLS